MGRRTWLGMLLIAGMAAACGGATVSTAPASDAAVARTAMPAGAYQSTAFRPPINVTLPDGWVVAGDAAEQYSLEPAATDLAGVHVFRSPKAASQDLDCPTTPAAGVGDTAADLVAWIRDRPGLVVGDPVPVTIGGLAGQQIDVAIRDGWTASCPFAGGTPTVPLFAGDAATGFRWVVAGTERLRLAVLDEPAGGTVVVDIDAFDGTLMDGLLAEATPIVGSLRFGLP